MAGRNLGRHILWSALLLRDEKYMIRSQLVQQLADANPTLRHNDIETIVGIFFDSIIDHLAKGGRVELRGFGSFSTRARAPRTGRNPRTGESVAVPAKRVIHFKAGREIRQRLNAD